MKAAAVAQSTQMDWTIVASSQCAMSGPTHGTAQGAHGMLGTARSGVHEGHGMADGALHDAVRTVSPASHGEVGDAHGHGASGDFATAKHHLEHRWMEKTAFGAAERVVERMTERVGERLAERVGERMTERVGERLVEGVGERLAERSAERLVERGMERGAEILGRCSNILGKILHDFAACWIYCLLAPNWRVTVSLRKLVDSLVIQGSPCSGRAREQQDTLLGVPSASP